MSGMFECASSFNQPLNDWRVDNVTDMREMFECASSFNLPPRLAGRQRQMRCCVQSRSAFEPAAEVSMTTNETLRDCSAPATVRACPHLDVEYEGVTDMSWLFHGKSNFNDDMSVGCCTKPRRSTSR